MCRPRAFAERTRSFCSGRGNALDLDFDDVGDIQQAFASRAEDKIVQSDLIALFAEVAAGLQNFGIRLDSFQQLDDGVSHREGDMPALQQRPSAEVHEGFVGSDQILQPDHQQAVSQHLLGSETAFGAVELVASGMERNNSSYP